MPRGRKKKEVPKEEETTKEVSEAESSEEYPKQGIDESEEGDLE